MLVFLHEMLLKVPTPLIWSLKPYGLVVPRSCKAHPSVDCLGVVMTVGVYDLRCEQNRRVQGNENDTLTEFKLTTLMFVACFDK